MRSRARMHTCAHGHVRTHALTGTYAHMRSRARTHTCAHRHVRTHALTGTYARAQSHARAETHTCTLAHTHRDTRVPRPGTYRTDTHTHTHTHKHTYTHREPSSNPQAHWLTLTQCGHTDTVASMHWHCCTIRLIQRQPGRKSFVPLSPQPASDKNHTL